MSDIKLTKAAFKFGVTRYFRGKAENVRLGSYGEKKTPLTQGNYLAVQNNINSKHFAEGAPSISGPYDMEWSKFSDSDVNLSISFLKKGGGTGAFNRNAAKSAKLKLVKFFFPEARLKKLLNQHADGARNWLAGAGNSGRVVSEVWVVMEAELASQVTTGGKVTGDANIKGFNVSLNGSTSSTSRSTVRIPADTTFAYLLHKVKSWQDRCKKKISDLEDDQPGPN